MRTDRDPELDKLRRRYVAAGRRYLRLNYGILRLSDEVFSWGVWVSLSRENFSRSADLWDTLGREAEKPYFGWLTTDLPVYSPTTLNLKTHVHTRPVGERPNVELEPTDHPLAVEQRAGITLDRVREIAEAVFHSGSSEEQ